MRIANLAGRLVLLSTDGSAIDVAKASAGQYDSDPQNIYNDWSEFRTWASTAQHGQGQEFDPAELGPLTPSPRQILAIGMNYRDHAEEIGAPTPEVPSVFTKFATSLTGPHADITLPPGNNDWEVEVVVIIGRSTKCIEEDEAWNHVAGLTIGQDISERITQTQGPQPQFSLGKSFPGFGPIGPWLVTVDEFDNPDDLGLRCSVNGKVMQDGRTSDMVFSIPRLLADLSRIIELQPGDVIFTGTPAGVGAARNPQIFLQSGDELVSWVEGIGEMHHTILAGQ